MTTILDLPDEIHSLIAKHLTISSLNSCIRTCRIFYASFTPLLWSNISPIYYYTSRPKIPSTLVRARAHHVETIHFFPVVTGEYYDIFYPRLRTLCMNIYSENSRTLGRNAKRVELPQKAAFVRQHPFVRKLVCIHHELLPREFWEVVGTEWMQLESLEFSGPVDEGAEDAFWTVCDHVQELSLKGVRLLENNSSTLSILSRMSFQRLCQLTVGLCLWQKEALHRAWPFLLLERVKRSEGLRRLTLDVEGANFPVQMVLDALAEGCWPELCEFSPCKTACADEDMARVLRTLTPRRLRSFERRDVKFGALTFDCLQEIYFDHLWELDVRNCSGVTSSMVQEVMTGCPHLIILGAPHIFVRDIATASKPWVCLGLEKLMVYFAKQKDDKPEWERMVFEQIARLRRLLILDLKRNSCFPITVGSQSEAILDMQTLDLRLIDNDKNNNDNHNHNDNHNNSSEVDVSDNVGNIRCWSSLVQLQELSFDSNQCKLGMDELVWMTAHWPDLHNVCEGFEGIIGEEECAKRDRILRQAELSTFALFD